MTLSRRPVDELCRIAVAGGGLRLDASFFTTDDLYRIGTSASNKQAWITFYNSGHLSFANLYHVANGEGRRVLRMRPVPRRRKDPANCAAERRDARRWSRLTVGTGWERARPFPMHPGLASGRR